jgi:hypothetical protein
LGMKLMYRKQIPHRCAPLRHFVIPNPLQR